MPRTENQKIKMVWLLEILQNESSENSPLSTDEIIKKLNKRGIGCERKALYDDIRVLNESGYQIEIVKQGQKNLYFAKKPNVSFTFAQLINLIKQYN